MNSYDYTPLEGRLKGRKFRINTRGQRDFPCRDRDNRENWNEFYKKVRSSQELVVLELVANSIPQEVGSGAANRYVFERIAKQILKRQGLTDTRGSGRYFSPSQKPEQFAKR